MPPTMAVMALATLSNIYGCFNFQSGTNTAIAFFINKIRVFLIVIMFVRRAFIHRVAKNIRNKPREIVALN